MTTENQRLLYEAFKKSGQDGRAAEVLSRYPSFEEKEVDVNFSSMSKHELVMYAESAGIDISGAKTKDDLIVILENKSDEVE